MEQAPRTSPAPSELDARSCPASSWGRILRAGCGPRRSSTHFCNNLGGFGNRGASLGRGRLRLDLPGLVLYRAHFRGQVWEQSSADSPACDRAQGRESGAVSGSTLAFKAGFPSVARRVGKAAVIERSCTLYPVPHQQTVSKSAALIEKLDKPTFSISPSVQAQLATVWDSSCTDSDGWFRVSLAWMIFAVAVQTKGLGFLLVAAM